MKTITLDGKKIDTINELHLFFKEKLNFPEYYGMNLNAFWDCLTEGFEEPTSIIWINIEDSKRKLGEHFVADVVDLLEKGKKFMKNYKAKFYYEIQNSAVRSE